MFKKLGVFFLITSLMLPASAFAVGSGAFENASFSARSIGQDNAVVAQADEAAAISYNPAGITQLKGFQAQSSQQFIGVSTFYRGNNSDTVQSGGTLNYVPTAYMTLNPGKLLNDRLTLGIGSDSPFGLANKYESVHPTAQFVGYKNAIKMFTIKPVAALKINDKLSIGGGPIYYRLYDLNTVLAYPVGGAAAGANLRAQLSGNTWGWHMGILAKPWEKHQFGFYFRSPINLKVRGHVKVENSTILGNYQTGAWGEMALPLNMTWAYAYKPTKKLTIEADFGYTRWSIHRRLNIDHDRVGGFGGIEDSTLNTIGLQSKDFRDGYAIHLGGNYKVTPKWTVMAGTGFFTSIIPEKNWSAVIPDSNRLSFTLGTGYQITNYLGLDLAYYAGFNLPRRIDNEMVDALGQTLDGTYSSYVHGIYATLSYKWENLFGGSKDSSYVPSASEDGSPAPKIKTIEPESRASAMNSALAAQDEKVIK